MDSKVKFPLNIIVRYFFFIVIYLICVNISESSRDPRSVSINGIEIPVNTEWLTDEQLSELGRSGDENSALQSIRKFYDELEAETKKHAAENITKECYSWLSTYVRIVR